MDVPERTQQMSRMYVEQAMSYGQIAEEFGVSRQRVGQLLGPMNLASNQVEQRRALRARRLAEAHARIVSGESTTREEAERLGYANRDTLLQAFYDFDLKMPPHPEQPHGTLQRYNSRRFRCRCDRCRKANADYARLLRTRGGDPPTHGVSGYRNYGCRCPICRAAGSADNRNQRAKHRMRKEVRE